MSIDDDEYDDLDKILAGLDEPFGDEAQNNFNIDDRNPVLSAAKIGGKSALNAVFPREGRDEVILRALPDSFTEANDSAREISYTAKDLYSHTKEELVASGKHLQRKAAMLAPRIRGYIPVKKWRDKFDNWAVADDYSGGYGWGDGSNRVDSSIESTLNDVFRRNEQLVKPFTPYDQRPPEENGEDEKKKAKDEIRNFVTDKRQMEMTESLSRIQHYIERMSIDSHSTISWRRKSLEVGLRQLFLMSDVVGLIKSSNDRVIPAVEAIVKNTALPDYAKETSSEIAMAMAKRRLIESVSPADYSRKFIRNFNENAQRRISEIASEARSTMDYLDLLAENDDDEQQLTPEQEQAKTIHDASKGAGKLLAERYIVPYRDKLLSKVKKATDGNVHIRSLGDRLKYYTTNVASLYNTELTDETDSSLVKTLVTALSEIQGGYTGESVEMSRRNDTWLNSPAVNDNRLYVTQTEIIPAYLRSIDQAVWLMNGEDRDNMYDITTRTMVSADTFKNHIRKQVGQSTQKELYDGGLDGLVRMFDENKELSAEGRKELKDYFHDRISKNLTFNIKELASINNMNEVLSGWEDAEVFERRISELASEDLYGNMNKFADRFKRLRGLSGGFQDEVNRISLIHGDKALVDAGVFKRNDFGYLEVNKDLTDPSVRFERSDIPPRKARANEKAKDVVREFATAGSQDSFARKFDSATITADMSEVTESLDGVKRAIIDNSPLTKFDQLIALGEANKVNLITVIELMRAMKDEGVAGITVNSDEEETSKEGMGSRLKRYGMTGARGAGRLFGWGFRGVKGIGRGIFNTGKRLVAGAKDIYDEHGTRLLSGARLKAGEYYVKIGDKFKKIFTIDEIDGEVYDKDGNVILTAEEVSKAGKLRFMANGRWARVSDFIKTKVGSGVKGLFNLGGRAGGLGKRIASFAYHSFTDIPDVYVEGEKEPRLRSNLIRNGFYFCKNKVIRSVDDIIGEIRDKENRIIISEEEFNSPGFKLVDQKGNTVRSRARRLANYFANNLARTRKMAMGAISGGAKVAWGLTRGAAKKIKGLFSKGETEEVAEEDNKPGFFSRLFNTAKKVSVRTREYDVLVKIYNLLNKRLAGEKDDYIYTDSSGNPIDRTKSIFRRAKQAAKDKYEQTKPTFDAKVEEAKATATESYEKTAKHRRYLRMRGNKVKRNILEQTRRNMRAAKLKKKRVMRDFNRVAAVDGNYEAVKATGNKHLVTPAEKFIRRKAVLAARAARLKAQEAKNNEKVSDPLSMSDKIRNKLNDAQTALLKRIADSSEGTWVRGLAKDSDQLGIDSSFKQQMLLGFSKRFKGAVSRLYRGMASAKPEGEKTDSLWDKIKGKFKKDESKESNGLFSKIGEMLSGVGTALSSGISSLLSAVSTKIAALGVGSAIKSGLGAAATWAGGVVSAKAGAAAAFLMPKAAAAASAVGAGVAAVGSVITLPVVIGAAVVAGAGWLAYKHFTKVKPTIPGRVRFAQYGTREYANWSEDDAIKMIYLEEELKRYLKKSPTGSVIQGLTKEKAIELAYGYGVAEGNEVELLAFHSWLIHRFIPIYLLWNTRMADNTISGTTMEMEKSPPSLSTQKNLLNGVRLPASHPIFKDRLDPDRADRNILMRMSDWIGFTNNRLLNGEEVADITARALIEIDKLIERDNKRAQREKDNEKGTTNNYIETMKKNAPTSSYAPKGATAEAALRAMAGEDKAKGPQHIGAIQAMDAAAKTKIDLQTTRPVSDKEIYPVETGRFALYGIENPVKDTVMALREIERMAMMYVDVGSRSVDSIFYERSLAFASKLGSEADKQFGSKAVEFLKAWLRDRFIPMYIGYREALSKGFTGAALMTPNMTKDVHKALVSLVDTRITIGGKQTTVLEMPVGVEMVGDYLLIKDSATMVSVLNRIKPDDAVKIREQDNVKEVTAPKAQLRKRSTVASGGMSEFDKIKQTLGKEMKQISAERAEAPRVNIRNIKVDPENRGSGVYSDFANVKLNSKSDVALLIAKIAEAQGIDPELLLTTAYIESSFDPGAKPYRDGKLLSTAEGLFQFIDSTWNSMMKTHGNRLGIPANVSKSDPVANTLMAVEYFKENSKALSGTSHSPVDMYMTHFLGASGAGRFLRNMRKNPQAPAAKEMTSAASSNPDVYFDSKGAPRTYEQIYNLYTKKFVSGSSHIASITGGMYGKNMFNRATNEMMAQTDRRHETIQNKAAFDVASNSNGYKDGYTAVTPNGTVAKPGSTGMASGITMERVTARTTEFEQSNPGVTPEDTAVYREAVEAAYARPTGQSGSKQGDADVLSNHISKGDKTQTTALDLMRKQTDYQSQMVNLLGQVVDRLRVMNGEVSPREERQMEIDSMRNPNIAKSAKIPVDLSNRTVNVSRNREI